MIHRRRVEPETQSVWCVVETAGNASAVVAVKSNEGAAKIAARVQAARWPGEAWRVAVTGPHLVTNDFA